jgi:hypothetical protein
MQFIFVFSASMICVVLIVITKFQLDWLRGKVIRSTDEIVEDRIVFNMRALAKVQAEFVAAELDSFVVRTRNLHYLDTVINGFYYEGIDPFDHSENIAVDSSKSLKVNYANGAYYSRNSFSSSGEEKILNESCLNTFYSCLYSTSVTGFLQGYEIDEILYFYPESPRKADYTPLNAEWYHKAINLSEEFTITEPYFDKTSGWFSAFSKVIVLNDKVEGVIALNGSLQYAVSRVTDSMILDKGFLLLVGKEGVVMNTPDDWELKATSDYSRIFSESYSGISSKEWEEIKMSEDGSRHHFTDSEDEKFLMVKQGVYSEYLGLTHYILACVQIKTLQDFSSSTNEEFSFVYKNLFWAILACGLFTFCLASSLILSVARSQKIQLEMIKGIIQKFINKAILFGDYNRSESKMLKEFSEDFQTLYDACKMKLNKLEEVENGYVSHAWDYQKPGDVFLYQVWENEFYSFNYYSGKSFKWKDSIPKLRFNRAD